MKRKEFMQKVGKGVKANPQFDGNFNISTYQGKYVRIYRSSSHAAMGGFSGYMALS